MYGKHKNIRQEHQAAQRTAQMQKSIGMVYLRECNAHDRPKPASTSGPGRTLLSISIAMLPPGATCAARCRTEQDTPPALDRRPGHPYIP
jgi:hypothetical protein